jgi:xanthine dehydrogenase accessory factor
MSEETSILIFGIDELASAVARKLHLAGYAVAISQPIFPTTIRRRMSFADAWSDGSCTFEGVEARRADKSADFLAGLRSGMFVPILWHNFEEVTERWPWDVLIDARPFNPAKSRLKIRNLAEISIGLGPGFTAGNDCDIVIDTGGRDPGAVIRKGAQPKREGDQDDVFAEDGKIVRAPHHGLFHIAKFLGDSVEEGEILGWIGTTPIQAPGTGVIRGLSRDAVAVEKNNDLAEVAVSKQAELVGAVKRHRLIARSVAFVIEMERSGYTPISLENFF